MCLNPNCWRWGVSDSLEEHLDGVFDEFLEGLEPLGTQCAINHAMVARESHVDDLSCLKGGGGGGWCILGRGHKLSLRTTNCQDGGLGWIDDSSKLLDAKHAQVGNSEGTSLEVYWLEPPLASLAR